MEHPSTDKCPWCVRVCGGLRLESKGERRPREEKVAKAEELRNSTGIHTELFGLPAYSRANWAKLGHEGLREWVRAGEERE